MKKLLSLIGAILLFGLTATNASPITVNFSFTGPTANADASDYVSITDFVAWDSVSIEDNKATFTFNTSNWDDYTDLLLYTNNPGEYKLNIVLNLGYAGTMTYQQFNEYGSLGTITPNSNFTEWTIALTANDEMTLLSFDVEILPINGGGGNTEVQETTAYLSFYATQEDYEDDAPFYNKFNITATTDSGSISDFDVNKDDSEFIFTPSVTLTIQPISDYIVDYIMVVSGMDDLTESSNVEISSSNGIWTLTLKEGLPDNIFIYIMVAPDPSKKVTLKLLNGEYNWITGYIDMKSYLNFPEGEMSVTYSYIDNVTLYLSYGLNELKDTEFIVTCADADLTEGVEYKISQTTLGGDPFTIITLGEETPNTITFNISFPGFEATEKTATLNLVGIDTTEYEIVATAWYNEDFDGFDDDIFNNNSTATLTYTDYLGMAIGSEEIPLQVSCVTPGLTEGVDYIIMDGAEMDAEGYWYIYLNSDSPESIVFNVTPATSILPVTIEFAGANYKDGMVEVTTNTFEELDIVNGKIEYDYTDEAYLNFAIVGNDAENYELTFNCKDAQEGKDTYEVSYFNGVYSLTLYPGMYGKTLTVTVKVTVTIDEPSVIQSILTDETVVIYNLQGVRVNKTDNLGKGLYIINGKKVMTK